MHGKSNMQSFLRRYSMEKYKLKDICQVVNGRAYKQVELLQEGKYKVLRVGNFFTSDRWYYSDMELDENKYCDNDDLLYAWSASFGPRLWEGDKTIYHYHIWKMIPDPLKVNKYYLYYWLLNNANQLTAGTHGSVMAHITKNSMENQNIELPNLDIQFKVSDMLHTIDEKIKTNEKINRNLEEQALALYYRMFVETKNDGRTICRTDEFFEITIGKTPPRKEKEWFSETPSDCVWISISDMGSSGTFINDSSEYLTPEAVEKFNVKVVPDNTVILSFKLTVGRIAITVGPTTTNEAIAHFNTDNQKIVEYLYCYLKSFDFGALGSTSSIGIAVNSKTIKAMDFLIPEDGELQEFFDIVHPMFQQIKNNQFENQRLIAMRDSLLPKLMSGELDVSDIEI